MNTIEGRSFDFEPEVLHSVAGGQSVIDSPKLHIHTVAAAESFISTYGYSLSIPSDEEELWQFHRRAIVLMVEKLGFAEADIPEIVRDQKCLKDLRHLLVYASRNPRTAEDEMIQRWSCAVLRCMHVFVHSENDLFSSFSEEIQKQILTPFEDAVVQTAEDESVRLVGKTTGETVNLASFQVKPFKTSISSVIKLLAKPDAVAMKVFDKLGVRFVTKSIFDSFRVIQFLVNENLMSFPHIMPDQSSNTIYPVDLFLRICEKLRAEGKTCSDEDLESRFLEELAKNEQEIKYLRKHNDFSAVDYQFIKFISRKLVKVEREGKEPFAFFYPYEVQILDQKSYLKTVEGPSEHEAYKERQRLAARKRLFPDREEMADPARKVST